MRLAFVGGLVLVVGLGGAGARDAPVVLKRADLEKLEGTWLLKNQPTEGWKGTVRATIRLNKADGSNADFARILYDYDLANGDQKFGVSNAPAGGVAVALVRLGKAEVLVAPKDFGRPAPFKVVPADDLSAPVELKGDTLTLDLSKSRTAFVTGTLRELKIDWAKTTWERAKK